MVVDRGYTDEWGTHWNYDSETEDKIFYTYDGDGMSHEGEVLTIHKKKNIISKSRMGFMK